jgi:hypothetical protein
VEKLLKNNGKIMQSMTTFFLLILGIQQQRWLILLTTDLKIIRAQIMVSLDISTKIQTIVGKKSLKSKGKIMRSMTTLFLIDFGPKPS